MTSITRSGPRVCGSTVECLLTQRSLGSFSGLSAQPHHSSLSMAPPCNVKHVDSSSSQGFSQLVPTLIISHVLSNHQHPPPICQPRSPPLPKANSSQSPAWLFARKPLSIIQLSSSCRRALPHHPETLLSCPLEVCSSMTCMEKPAEPFSLVLATVVSLLLSPSCGFSPVSPLTQCGFHTSLPTRDQRGMMGTISHGHGAANHWTHKRDNKCHAKFQLLALVFAV